MNVATRLFLTLMLFSSPLLAESFSEPLESMEFSEEKTYYAVIHTLKGEVLCELFPDKAPISVTNFIQLAEAGFYDGLSFHQVVPGIVVQAGASTLSYTLPAEISLSHEVGSLALARLPDVVNPLKRSNSSQFYITLDALPFIDDSYTVFGRVVEGLEVLEGIEPGDKIDRLEIKTK